VLALVPAIQPHQPPAPKARQLKSLSISPDNFLLAGASARQQLLVTGHCDDGSIQDLTHTAKLSAGGAAALTIHDGVAHAKGDGLVTVTASSGGKDATAKVKVKDAAVTPPVSFRNDIMPLLSKAGCNAGTCHGNFNGKNGFRLSLRGEDPDFDLMSLTHDTHG